MHESRGVTAAIIGVVSLMLIGAAWFYLARDRHTAPPAAGSRTRTDPYSSYYRDMGEIADSLTPRPAATPGAPAANAPGPGGGPVSPAGAAAPAPPVNAPAPPGGAVRAAAPVPGR